MPINLGNSLNTPNLISEGTYPFFNRKIFVTDKDGVEHEILSEADMQAIIAQMTPEQLEDFKARYRFSPIENLTKNQNYTGTNRDL